MRSESGGRAVVIAPVALGSKDHPARPSKVPHRRISQATYPPRSIRLRNVENAPWRVLDMTISRVPEHGFQKSSLEGRRSFDFFPRRVGPGTWYPQTEALRPRSFPRYLWNIISVFSQFFSMKNTSSHGIVH